MNRLHKAIERDVYEILEEFFGEQNDARTRKEIERRVDQCLYEYHIFEPSSYTAICDESINTPEVIDNHKVRVSLLLRDDRLEFEYPREKS